MMYSQDWFPAIHIASRKSYQLNHFCPLLISSGQGLQAEKQAPVNLFDSVRAIYLQIFTTYAQTDDLHIFLTLLVCKAIRQ